MRLFLPRLLLLFSLTFSAAIAAQELPQRDPQAVAILQQSVAAMGGVVPSDSVAIGSVVIVAGLRTDSGTIRILSRGLDQAAERIQTSQGSRAVIYSRGQANELEGSSVKSLQLELVVTSQSPEFPLALLAGALNHSDTALQYLGLETLAGLPAHHIRLWNTLLSTPRLRQLAEFTVKELWIDASSRLPRKLAYDRRAARGAEPRIPVAVLFSDYRNVGGVVYPFRIEKWFNGTPWATITIQTVAFNTGLSDNDFPVQ